MKKIVRVIALFVFLLQSHVGAQPADDEKIQCFAAEIALAVKQADAQGVSVDDITKIVAQSFQLKKYSSGIFFMIPEEKKIYVKYVAIALVGIVLGVGIAYVPEVLRYFFSCQKASVVQPVVVQASAAVLDFPASVEEQALTTDFGAVDQEADTMSNTEPRSTRLINEPKTEPRGQRLFKEETDCEMPVSRHTELEDLLIERSEALKHIVGIWARRKLEAGWDEKFKEAGFRTPSELGLWSGPRVT